MRVTSLMIQRQSLTDVDRLRAQLANTQTQAASGLRVNRPSDDPNAAALAATLRAELDRTSQLESNATRAATRLEVTENALASATDLVSRARELAVSAADSTRDGALDEIAQEVAALHDELLQIANTQLAGDSIFGGFTTETAPFVRSGTFTPGSPAPTVSFVGGGNEIELEVNDGVRLASTLDGRRVFQGDADGVGGPDANRQDLFTSLEDFWTALQADDQPGLEQAIADFKGATEQIGLERARLGTRLSRLDQAEDSLANRELQIQRQLSDTQDADTVKVFSDLTLQQVSLEAALQVTSRALQLDLLDFLQ